MRFIHTHTHTHTHTHGTEATVNTEPFFMCVVVGSSVSCHSPVMVLWSRLAAGTTRSQSRVRSIAENVPTSKRKYYIFTPYNTDGNVSKCL